jgi:hypothetical protein
MRNFRGKIAGLIITLMVVGYQGVDALFAREALRASASGVTVGEMPETCPRPEGTQDRGIFCRPFKAQRRLVADAPGISLPANLRGASSVDEADALLTPNTFSHKSKEHSELDCAQCHSVTRDKIEVNEFPLHNACVDCHNFASEMMTPEKSFCGVCHESTSISKSLPALLSFPKERAASEFGYNFSHAAHLKSQPVEPACPQSGDARPAVLMAQAGRQPQCADCHRKIEAAGKPALEMAVETGHAVCFKCHCETPSVSTAMPAMRDCAKCHRIDGPRSPRLFDVVSAFHHGDHELDTRPRKKADAQTPRPADFLCAECHQSTARAAGLNEIRLPEAASCNQCHNGKAGLPGALAKEVVEGLNRR